MKDFEELYSWVKDLPVIDWHNHLDMQMLAEDKPLGSLYELWVKSDPYKHRAMRICGEPERLITGSAGEDEKWAAWMRTLPKLVGNPLFAWAKMEMEWLGNGERGTGNGEWWKALKNNSLTEWTPSKMLKAFNVVYISPCVSADGLKGLKTYDVGLKKMAHACFDSKSEVRSLKSSVEAVPSLRINAGDGVALETLERFHAAGCRVVDVSIDDISSLCLLRLKNIAAYATANGWTMLLHIGALRNMSVRLRAVAGPAGGFAGMRAPVDPAAVAALLNELEQSENAFSRKESGLPRTIIMPLNPEAHAQLAVLAGAFVEEGMPGKVQLGPAWWWCDHEEGIRDVLEKNAAYGVLSTFVGMTTDSRSLLSLVRHDYFRRVLCKWVAEKVERGAFPDDEDLLRPMLEKICYRNAKTIFVDEKEGWT